MSGANPQYGQALKRATLVAFIEAAAVVIPSLGALLKAGCTFYEEVTQAIHDLPEEDARRALQRMHEDCKKFLQNETSGRARETVELALLETFAILEEQGLSDDELVTEAGLAVYEAARHTLQRAEDHLRPLEEETKAMVQRLVEEYYRVLLSHHDMLSQVGVPALRALLEQTADLEQRLRDLTDAIRTLLQPEVRRAWQALRPVEEPITVEGPVQLAQLKAPNRLVPFRGEAHRLLRPDPRDEAQPLYKVLRGVSELSPTQTAFWSYVCCAALERAQRVPRLAATTGGGCFGRRGRRSAPAWRSPCRKR